MIALYFWKQNEKKKKPNKTKETPVLVIKTFNEDLTPQSLLFYWH